MDVDAGQHGTRGLPGHPLIGKPMEQADKAEHELTPAGAFVSRSFLKAESIVYAALGLILVLASLLGIGSAGEALWNAAREYGSAELLVVTVDRLLFALMIVEILHTVRVSFRSGTLVGQPFLVVGLIASIRRVLVITLETTQATGPGKWTPDSQAMLNAHMLELAVLGGLILILVLSIYTLRRSEQIAGASGST